MPEYLAPGVYLEESDSGVTPIPGVSTSIDDATLRRLVESFRAILGLNEPDWTRFNQTDPGVTLIQLIAWLGESLLYRTDDTTKARRDAARRAFARLSTDRCASACAPLRRPRYFAGQLLTAATLEVEQDYQRDKLRRHNLALHGVGIVCGLGVHVDAGGDGLRVTIDPGCAIDPRGDELALCERVAVRLPAEPREAFVSLRRWDRPGGTTPGPEGPETTWIEEATLVAISARVPVDAVTLARLTRGSDGWSVDAGPAPPSSAPKTAV
jgi:hypothetical protein